MPRFYGKYRGKVEANVDPAQLGRVQVSVPAVLGETRAWAMPCTAFAGPGVGLVSLPPVGANVWVEFEGGDPDYPIAAGCFWAPGEFPAVPDPAETKVLTTDGITVSLDDRPGAGGFTIDVSPPIVNTPLKLVFDSNGIEVWEGANSVKLIPTSP